MNIQEQIKELRNEIALNKSNKIFGNVNFTMQRAADKLQDIVIAKAKAEAIPHDKYCQTLDQYLDFLKELELDLRKSGWEGSANDIENCVDIIKILIEKI